MTWTNKTIQVLSTGKVQNNYCCALPRRGLDNTSSTQTEVCVWHSAAARFVSSLWFVFKLCAFHNLWPHQQGTRETRRGESARAREEKDCGKQWIYMKHFALSSWLACIGIRFVQLAGNTPASSSNGRHAPINSINSYSQYTLNNNYKGKCSTIAFHIDCIPRTSHYQRDNVAALFVKPQ